MGFDYFYHRGHGGVEVGLGVLYIGFVGLVFFGDGMGIYHFIQIYSISLKNRCTALTVRRIP